MGQRRQEGRSEDSEKTILLSGKTLDEAVAGKVDHSMTRPQSSSWTMCYLCRGSRLTISSAVWDS